MELLNGSTEKSTLPRAFELVGGFAALFLGIMAALGAFATTLSALTQGSFGPAWHLEPAAASATVVLLSLSAATLIWVAWRFMRGHDH